MGRKALLTNLILLLINLFFLTSVTYAWWSESIIVKNNAIITGNLEVTFEAADDIEFTHGVVNLKDKGASIVNFHDAYPGQTITRYIKVKNNGSIDMAYFFNVIILSDEAMSEQVSFSISNDRHTLLIDEWSYQSNYISLMAGEEEIYKLEFKISETMEDIWQDSRYNFVLALESRQLLEIQQTGKTYVD